MVTAEQVWAALEEIPDPEIPVVSLVDLGVIRSVDVSEGHVHVEFTPTFLGCPALEFMKRAIEDKVPGVSDVEVIQDDSWSTDKITAAGREKLREAGFAPPAPRARADPGAGAPVPVLRLDGHEAREHLRPDAVPFTSLLRELPAAVRAVQDDLSRIRRVAGARAGLLGLISVRGTNAVPTVERRHLVRAERFTASRCVPRKDKRGQPPDWLPPRTRIGLCGFDRDLGCRLSPRDTKHGSRPVRHPPVCVAEELHQGRDEEGTDDGGIEDDPCREADRE